MRATTSAKKKEKRKKRKKNTAAHVAQAAPDPRRMMRPSTSAEEQKNIYIGIPPKDGGGLTISGILKSFEGPVLNLGAVQSTRALYLNELVVHEIRNNASAIF
jgi:hypothetical protein